MQMKKLTVLLIMLLSLCACALAESYPDPLQEKGYYYDVENGGAVITSYTGGDSTLEIPSMLGGYPVTKIGYNAFDGHDYLQTVKLPVYLEHIGWYAFSGCYNMREVIIPEGVKSIGKYAFSGCYGLEEIHLPDTLETIYGYAFSYCSNLRSIAIPANVHRITNFTFEGCYELRSITINGKDTMIYPHAFSSWYDNLSSLSPVPDACDFVCWSSLSSDDYSWSPELYAQNTGFTRVTHFQESLNETRAELPPEETISIDLTIDDKPVFVHVEPTALNPRSVSLEIDLVDAYGETVSADGHIEIPVLISYEVLGMTRTQARRLSLTVEHKLSASHSEFFSTRNGTARLTKKGLEFTVSSFSPFEITWEENADPSSLPKTGDPNLPLAVLVVLLVGCATLSCCLSRKKA